MSQVASKQDEKFREYALNAAPLRVIFTVCAPLALYQGLCQLFSILDALMAAHISAGAVSAISSLAQVTAMINALGAGLAVGGCIKISESYGMGDYQEVRQRTSTLYAVTVICGLVIAVVLVPFAVPFLRLLNTPEELIIIGAGYFRIEVIDMVLRFFNTVFIAIERSRGHSKLILVLNIVTLVVKLGLSALFVYVLETGVVMVAVATLVSQAVITLYALIKMPRDEGAFRFSSKAVKIRKAVIGPILTISFPVAAEKLLFAAGKVIVNAMSGGYGPLTVGALGISNNIGGFTTNLHAGVLDGGSALIGQNHGAGKTGRSIKIFHFLLVIDVVIGLAGLIIVSIFLPQIASVFAHSRDEFNQEFCDMIVAIHRYEMLGYIMLGINSAVNAFLLGYGYAKLTMMLNVARVFVFRVPVLWYLQQFTAMGSEAVGVTMMVSNVATGLFSIVVIIPVIRKLIKSEKALGVA
ncbi:MAG: MATE family efflux transporter [Clostridiales bacterium]|nr:MATE family efflux transporter [Clostridiales bacterium]